MTQNLKELKILIVDDSPFERAKLKDILCRHGAAQIHEAENAADGIDIATEKMPDIIFMDVTMPGMSGFQAVKKIKQSPPLASIKVVLCTSKGEPTDKVWGERQGADGYLVKPVGPDALIQEIERLTI